MPHHPSPHAFTIPTATHGIPARLYIPGSPTPPTHFPPSTSTSPKPTPSTPLKSSQASQRQPTIAILAHPYAPLGGSYNDPVISLLTTTLLDQGIFVVTFNFYGGTGKVSWRGSVECGEYQVVLKIVRCFIMGLVARLDGRLDGSLDEGRSLSDGRTHDDDGGDGERSDVHGIGGHIIIGGYSFGALIAAQVDTQTNITFQTSTSTSTSTAQSNTISSTSDILGPPTSLAPISTTTWVISRRALLDPG